MRIPFLQHLLIAVLITLSNTVVAQDIKHYQGDLMIMFNSDGSKKIKDYRTVISCDDPKSRTREGTAFKDLPLGAIRLTMLVDNSKGVCKIAYLKKAIDDEGATNMYLIIGDDTYNMLEIKTYKKPYMAKNGRYYNNLITYSYYKDGDVTKCLYGLCILCNRKA